MKSKLYIKFTKDELIVDINKVIHTYSLKKLSKKQCDEIFALMVDKQSTLKSLAIKGTEEITYLLHCDRFIKGLGKKISSIYKNQVCVLKDLHLIIQEELQKTLLVSIKGVRFSKLKSLVDIDPAAMNPFLKNNKFKSILLVPPIIDNENVDFIIDSMNNSVNKIVGIEMDAFTNYEFAAILKIIENANFRHDEDRRHKIYLSSKDEAEGGGVIKQLALIYKAMRKNFIMDKIDIYYDSSDEDIDTNQQTEIDKRNAHLKKLCKELGLIQAVPQFIKDFPDAKEEFIQYLEKYLLKGHLMNYLRPGDKKNLNIFLELFEDKFKIDFTIISELDKQPQEKFSDDDDYDYSDDDSDDDSDSDDYDDSDSDDYDDSDSDDYDDSDDDGCDDDEVSSSFDKRKKAALEHKKEILDENHNSKHGFKNIPQIKEICFKAKDNIDKSNAQVDEQNLKVDDSEIKISKLQDHDNNYDQSDREVIGQT